MCRFWKIGCKMVISHPQKGGKWWCSVLMGRRGWVYWAMVGGKVGGNGDKLGRIGQKLGIHGGVRSVDAGGANSVAPPVRSAARKFGNCHGTGDIVPSCTCGSLMAKWAWAIRAHSGLSHASKPRKYPVFRIPPFPPFFHPDTWILGFLFTALWGSRLPLGKMGKMGPARVPFFTHLPPISTPFSSIFSFLLEQFHTFSMMYL